MSTQTPRLSVLDLVPVRSGQSSTQAVRASLDLVRLADRLGFERYWFAEHHNMPAVAASTPPVMIAAAASVTDRIRVGSGGVMLPNHAPLVIAEQYGTLEFGRYTELLMAGYNVAIQALAKWQADGRLPTHARGVPTATRSAARGLRARGYSI